jgi:hypothetical protein
LNPSEGGDAVTELTNMAGVEEYRGWTREQALRGDNVLVEGFKPNRANKISVSYYILESPPQRETAHFIKGKDYGFEDGKFFGSNRIYPGFQCGVAYPKPLQQTEPTGNIIATYEATATITVKLRYNEILYPRTVDKYNDAPNLEPEELRRCLEKIYLHEVGHQLDTWNIIPRNGKTIFSEIQTKIFCGTKNEIEKQAKIWLNTISMDLQELIDNRYKREIDTELNTARILYHNEWGFSGNPWDGPEGPRE